MTFTLARSEHANSPGGQAFHAADFLRDEIASNLRRFHAMITVGDSEGGIAGIERYMAALHAEVDRLTWNEVVRPEVYAHEAHSVMLEDPYTQRAYAKPRGYAGDAEMIDYLYFRKPPQSCSSIGAKLFDVSTRTSNAQSVADRRLRLGNLIDQVAASRTTSIRVLSVACGHVRESEVSDALQQGAVCELAALDQDAESLATVMKDYGHLPIVTLAESIKSLFVPRPDLGAFDLIYSTGLYDYLTESVATRLTTMLFKMLREGGTLLIPNFLPTNQNRGYMESFMDWNLILRTEDDMSKLLTGIPTGAIAEQRVFRDERSNIVYLEVIKA